MFGTSVARVPAATSLAAIAFSDSPKCCAWPVAGAGAAGAAGVAGTTGPDIALRAAAARSKQASRDAEDVISRHASSAAVDGSADSELDPIHRVPGTTQAL